MTRLPRTIIRIGRQTLAFALPQTEGAEAGSGVVHYEPYTVKSGMSIAANLRNAFRDSIILSQGNERVSVLIDTPVMLVPTEEYEEEQMEALFHHTFPGNEHETVMCHILPGLNCVAVFSINKDTRMVITDHYADVRIVPAVVPVWQHMHQTSYAGQARKLYAYFHDRQLSVFAFAKNRFRFANTFSTTAIADSAYYIFYVWQQLAFDQKKDELYLVGEISDPEGVRAELRKYVQNVFQKNPSAEFNRAPVTQVQNITYDIVCHVMG